MLKRNGGFTLIELLFVLMLVLAVGVIGIGFLGHGNFWYLESDVLKVLRADHPEVSEVLKTHRNVFAKSIVTVKEGAIIRDYCLDTDIFWNYEFSTCSR